MSRTVSEVIVSVESKLDHIMDFIKNQDMNIKILLNRISLLEKSIKLKTPEEKVKPKIEAVLPTEDPVKTSQMPGLKPGITLGKKVTPKQETFVDVSGTSNKKIPVQQKIIYNDGKNLSLANVEIFDINGNLIKKIRTGSIGKWNASLEPGQYSVMVSKRGANAKLNVETSYEVSIPPSNAPVELDVHKLM